MSFLNIVPCYYFSLEAFLQGMTKNNPTEKQIDGEMQVTLKHGQRENSKCIATN